MGADPAGEAQPQLLPIQGPSRPRRHTTSTGNIVHASDANGLVVTQMRPIALFTCQTAFRDHAQQQANLPSRRGATAQLLARQALTIDNESIEHRHIPRKRSSTTARRALSNQFINASSRRHPARSQRHSGGRG
jgi:hypothetical protein